MSFDISNTLRRWRSFIWPIEKHEYRKFFPMLILFALISFNYNLLRAAKDALIVTAPHSGAEALPFIKLWCMLPMAVIMTLIFTKLSNKYGREKVFYIMVSIFLGYYCIFTCLLYPAKDILHPTIFIDRLAETVPEGFRGFLAIFRNWTFTSFYVMSELWSTIVLSVLFWGFANEVTSVNEAKRFYAILGVGANIATMLSGQLAVIFSKHVFNPNLIFGNTAWEQTLTMVNITVLLVGLLIMAIFRFYNVKVINKEEKHKENLKTKEKSSLKQNFSYLSKSKYLICIAVIVLTYNISINLVEIVWKNQVKLLYPNPSDYNSYMGNVATCMGALATFTGLFLTNNFLRKFSWSFTALIPPIMMFLTGIAFFSFFYFKDAPWIAFLATVTTVTPLTVNVFLGSMQNSVSRACKYTLFDATKEMTFIPLDNEAKRKGKAAIDGVGSRIGKSGGSLIHQGLLIVFSTLSASTPYIGAIFFFITLAWISAVTSLGKQFNALVLAKEKISIPEAEEPVAKPVTQVAIKNIKQET